MKLHRDSYVAFLMSVPIGMLGGLIGLGGAEFRLPVLTGVLRRNAREAVTINLAVSFITIISSLLTRLSVAKGFPFWDLLPVCLSMILGGMIFAFVTAGVVSEVSHEVLENWMKVLLITIGGLLIIESYMPTLNANLLQSTIFVIIFMGIVAGTLIGIVSSTLGVAGGELIIPTLVFIFGVGVKTAGTASLLISLPTVCAGLYRYYKEKAFFTHKEVQRIVVPMGIGSVIGSILGGLLFGIISPNILKLLLGLLLIFSALRMFSRRKDKEAAEVIPPQYDLYHE